MVKVTVCIGSSCHLKGSRQVVEGLQKLIAEENLKDYVDLGGAFCMGKCNADGVSVTVDGEYFAVKPEDVAEFFNKQIKSKINL